MVDLSQNGLNFLGEIVAQMKAVYEAIGNEINHLDSSSLPEPRKDDDVEAVLKSLLTGQPPAPPTPSMVRRWKQAYLSGCLRPCRLLGLPFVQT
jgi:hypothetical protein